MGESMRMDQRKKKILEAIIKSYIETAEPVGSRTIARKYDLGVSPATIRNEMADLEELGLIEQPHTSAGRVPSDYGYRYYVDCLMEEYQLSPEEIAFVKQRYAEKVEQIEEVLERTGKLLSSITNYVALVSGPQVKANHLKYVRLLSLSSGKALLVTVFRGGLVQHRAIDIPAEFTLGDLERISNVLNHNLQEYTLQQLKEETLVEICQEVIKEKLLVRKIAAILARYLTDSDDRGHVYLGGTLNILSQPEFRDVEKVRLLLHSLEQEQIIWELLESKEGEGLTIKIGGENKQEGIDQCSVITATYHINGEVAGTIGLLGPTRMMYPKAVSLVKLVTDNLSEVLKKYY